MVHTSFCGAAGALPSSLTADQSARRRTWIGGEVMATRKRDSESALVKSIMGALRLKGLLGAAAERGAHDEALEAVS